MDRRIPMIAGIAFAVLFATALLMVPTLPGIDKPGYDIVSHVNEDCYRIGYHLPASVFLSPCWF
jgi:hypothetical protein